MPLAGRIANATLARMGGPYRQTVAEQVVEAPTRDGPARLRLAPDHVLVEVASQFQLSVGRHQVTLTHLERRRPRTQSFARRDLILARAVPGADIAFWQHERPGVVGRLAAVRPPQLLDQAALHAWAQIDRLARHLERGLERDQPVAAATEYGRGQNRVLLRSEGEALVVYARPLFRERPRRTLEVRADGAVLVPSGGHDHRLQCRSRCSVTVLGDRIRFHADDGRQTVSVWLPWIAPEDRAELAYRLGALVERGPASASAGTFSALA
jgi:hypothetical protein